MNTVLMKVAMITSIFGFILCSTLGIVEIVAAHVGIGIFTIIIGATNLVPFWFNWKRLKKLKELEPQA